MFISMNRIGRCIEEMLIVADVPLGKVLTPQLRRPLPGALLP